MPPQAARWYGRGLGAAQLWSLGSVLGLEIEGAPFLVHEPTSTGFVSPAATGETTVRVRLLSATSPSLALEPVKREPVAQPTRHFWQCTSGIGLPTISLRTQSTSFTPLTSSS
jgi:hypothetical protein